MADTSTDGKVTFWYNGEILDNYSRLIANMHANEMKEFQIMMNNGTSYKLENIKFVTSLPPDSYSISLPKSIPAKQTNIIKLKLIGQVLFEDPNISAIAAEISYSKIKLIESK